jgi:Flp pilus assembly protein TadB
MNMFHLWAERWRRHEATNDVILRRYSDDIDVGFEHEGDARRFWNDMRMRTSGRGIDAAALRTAAVFCGAGLFVWLLIATYAFDLGPGFF